MNRYELVVMIDAHLNQDQKDAIVKQVEETLTQNGAKILNTKVWIEKQKIPFKIKRVQEFSYYLLEFEIAASALSKVRSRLRLNEAVYRYLIVKMEKITVK